MPLRFNHMELSLPQGTFEKDKDNIINFYKDVLGFEGMEVPMVDFDCPKYLLSSDSDASQFLFLVEDKDALVSKTFDHLGFLLDTREEVDVALAKVKEWQKKDPRVEIIEYDDMDAHVVITHAFYFRYILPIWFDVQALEFKPGCEPKNEWTFGEAKKANG